MLITRAPAARVARAASPTIFLNKLVTLEDLLDFSLTSMHMRRFKLIAELRQAAAQVLPKELTLLSVLSRGTARVPLQETVRG